MSKTREEDPKALIRHEAPGFIVAAMESDTSTAALEKQRVLPKAIIVQGLSSDDLKALGEGSVIVASTVIAKAGDEFHVVPVFYFDQYVTERDRNDKTGPKLMVNTFDEKHEVAIFSEDPKRRTEEYAGGPSDKPWVMRHVHRRCFACVLYGDHPMAGAPIILNFHKGDAMDGINWINACLMRKIGGRSAPLWSQVWKIQVVKKFNKNGEKWWGLRAVAPDGSIWITEKEGPEMQKLYEGLKSDHLKNLLAVDEGTGDEGEAIEDKKEAF